MTNQELLFDLSITRQLLLTRVANGESRAYLKLLSDIADELTAYLNKSKPMGEMTKRELTKAIQELKAIVQLPELALAPIVSSEVEWQVGTLAQIGINATLPSAAVIAGIAETSLVQGALVSDWLNKLSDDVKFGIEQQIKLGAALNETNAQIIKRVMGFESVGTKGSEPFKMLYRDAESLVRTAVMTYANDAKMALYDRNLDIIKGYRHVSTLDSRTSDICMARSGKWWRLPDYKPVGHTLPFRKLPAHFRCRSLLLPVLKTQNEIGAGLDEPDVKRASDAGYVSADMAFDQFLKTKPKAYVEEMLGKGRYELWQKGIITTSNLIDRNGRSLTIDELINRYAPDDYVV